MSTFRQDMINLSSKYSFVKKVIISDESWEDMCKSFDKDLDRSEGTTQKHIADLNGSMCFETLYVEKEEL